MVKIDGYEVSPKAMREELANVVHNYPVWPGDVICKRAAKACRQIGWIVRDGAGNWIPTADGVWKHEFHRVHGHEL